MEELIEMTPDPMHSMIEKESKLQAVEKRNKRSSMVVRHVLATAPGSNVYVFILKLII